MIKMGTWRVHSETDPRWNNSGICEAYIFYAPPMEEWINKCKEEFGEPPEDATQEFWKD